MIKLVFEIFISLIVLLVASYWIYFWQLKEYYWKRVRSALKEKSNWRQLLILPILKNPKFFTPTKRALLIFILTLIFNLGFVFYLKFNLFSILVLLFSQPLIVSFAVIVSDLFVFPLKYLLFRKAQAKIKKLKNQGLKVIAIIGSFGKTSTKEFLSQLLKANFKILATPGRVNVDLAIARLIVSKLQSTDKFFICEMEAYSKKEFLSLAKFVQPEFVIFTGLAEQHLDVFGSWGKLVDSYFAPLSLAKTILINHQITKKISINQKLKNLNSSKIFFYGEKGDFTYQILENSLDYTKFKFSWREGEITFKTNLFYPPLIENLTAGLAMMKILNIPLENLMGLMEKLTPPAHCFQMIKKHPLIIDDSYNANPYGVEKGLEFFVNSTPSFKVLIFSGIIELGRKKEEIFQRFFPYLKKFNYLFITHPDFYKFFRLHFPTNCYLLKRKNQYFSFLRDCFQKKSAILILGRQPKIFWQVFSKFLTNSNF